MGRNGRTGKDLGREGTVEWLEAWYDGPLDFAVEPVVISQPSPPRRSHWAAAKTGRQTEQHVMLKYAARCWLEDLDAGTVTYERRLYLPGENVTPGQNVQCNLPDGGVTFIDVSEPKILVRGDRLHPCHYGSIITVDVLCEADRSVSVEVGATSPFNLVSPLLDGLVHEALWLPFPSPNETDAKEGWKAYRLRPIADH